MTDSPPLPAWVSDWLVAQARDWQALLQSAAAPGSNAAPIIERYRQLFLPQSAQAALAGMPGAGAGAAWQRWQGAMSSAGALATAIGIDAYARFTAALASTDPAAQPITTLAELHDLWVDCGEAAYAEVAHSRPFAAAQAELLSAFVELRAATQTDAP